MRTTHTGWMGLCMVAVMGASVSWAPPTPAGRDKADVWGAARFQPLLGLLKDAFRKSDPRAVADARDVLFRFEGLLRLYVGVGAGPVQDHYPTFSNLRVIHDQIKQIEDEVGGLLQFDSLIANGHGSASDLKAQEAALERQLRQVLTDGGWFGGKSTRLDKIDAELKHTDFGTPESDRNLLLARVAAQLAFAGDRVYDMNNVEGGIHELRRETRWFRYYAVSLSPDGTPKNSLLRTTPDHCPLTGPGPDLDRMAGPGPCVVSSCLVDALGADETLLDGLKRVAANDAADGKGPSPEMVQRAESVRQDLKDRLIMSSLAIQVQSCMTKK